MAVGLLMANGQHAAKHVEMVSNLVLEHAPILHHRDLESSVKDRRNRNKNAELGHAVVVTKKLLQVNLAETPTSTKNTKRLLRAVPRHVLDRVQYLCMGRLKIDARLVVARAIASMEHRKMESAANLTNIPTLIPTDSMVSMEVGVHMVHGENAHVSVEGALNHDHDLAAVQKQLLQAKNVLGVQQKLDNAQQNHVQSVFMRVVMPSEQRNKMLEL